MSAQHKFAVGQAVRFLPDLGQGSPAPQASRSFACCPEAASVFQYRVKSQLDGHERVVREDQLTQIMRERVRCRSFR